MWQLKNNGYIDHMIFSVYMQMNEGNSTHIKFGGFDEEGIKGGDAKKNLIFLKTKDKTTWEIPLQTVKLGETMLDVTAGSKETDRFVLFELAYPFIYMPLSDFQVIAKALNSLYTFPVCDVKKGNCIFSRKCSDVPDIDAHLNLTLSDSDYNRVRIKLT
mmetsp:Transcript_5551/g.9502  ORF Transcript_5551/g.9502 Transcript_5551/m.9502 type:complete len:159 (+) Transcript_5551:624-1100(+)